MAYAFIQNNTIVEVVANNPYMIFVQHYAEKFVEVPDSCKTGDVFLNDEWVTPVPPQYIPKEITMRQARLALLDAGLLGNVQAAINSLPEPDKTKAQIEWDYSNSLQRNNSFVSVLGTALGLSEQDIDNLFVQASAL